MNEAERLVERMSEQYNELMRIAGDTVLTFERNGTRLALCPKLGGRIFVGIGDLCPHRMDLANILEPTREFNNFGGGNFWPAPEGGKFGFNYDGDRWRVQSAINLQPFELVERGDDTAVIGKRVSLVNRAGIVIEADMVRRLRLASEVDVSLAQYPLEYYIAYITEDSFEILNHVRLESALIGAWTLEQFAASADTVSFCQVQTPEGAINYDFYDHPGERIKFFPRGFTYRTDGLSMGQIGVAADAKASLIGFYNLSTRILCIRRNLSDRGCLFQHSR
jgi:hypothetical protein